MATDPYGQGLNFRGILDSIPAGVANKVAVASHRDQVGFGQSMDFFRGALGMGRPSVTTDLPAAKPVAKPVAAAAAKPKAAAAAGTPAQGSITPDLAAALGKMSFRQLLTLGQIANQTDERSSTRYDPNPAATFLTNLSVGQFQKSLDSAKNDTEKKAAVEEAKKQLLPLALRGNDANEYTFGGFGGNQN
jgi:hypothetical protein